MSGRNSFRRTSGRTNLAPEIPEGERAAQIPTIEALRQPSVYPGDVGTVEVRETHFSWVFLTEAHAFKLKKPIRSPLVDWRTPPSRRRACENELRLNRRLAPSVYLAVVPVTNAPSGYYQIDGDGSPVDWLVKMKRLPAEHTLERRLCDGAERGDEIDRLGRTLANFYQATERVPERGLDYLRRLSEDVVSKGRYLGQRRFGLDREKVGEAVRSLRVWIERHGALLRARGARVVDAHGDLRPEHVYLSDDPVAIDCLDFDRTLRLLDPVSELSFLSLECRRLGANWIGNRLMARYADETGDRTPARLTEWYEGYHALIRATVAVWHLENGEADRRDHWCDRSARYVDLSRSCL